MIAPGLLFAIPALAQTWKAPILAQKWAVAAGHPQSAMAAAAVLDQGGNAVDAAVAATFAASVVQPANTGIGGHAMVMIYLARTGQVYCIDGSGWSGRRAQPSQFDPAAGGLPFHGPLAPVVPGLVSAMLKAAGKFGKLPTAKILEPAIRLAGDGFVVTPYLTSQLRGSQATMMRYDSTRRIWYPNGEALSPGVLLRQPDLAATLRLIAKGGLAAYYGGPIGRRVVAFLKANGGLLEEQDFAEYSAREGPALHANYRGYDIYEGPQWSFDHIGLETLKILEGFDLRAMGHLSPAYIHHVTEAMKLAFADRDWSVEDRRFPESMPLLIRDDFAASRRKLLRADRALDPAPHGSISASGNTDYVGVIDSERNMVSITSSISGGFGNMMYVDGPGGGFFLNNWMPLFKLDPQDANVLEPHKVPRTGWSPMLALKDGKPFAAFGTPGGDTIAQAQLQFFIHLADFGMDVQTALEQPWFRTEAFKAYRYPNAIGKNLVLSDRIPAGTRAALAALGHVTTTHNTLGIGSVRAVTVDQKAGTLSAGSAPGRDETALGR
jgi:gamma-glutamyltranspeptidase/glutathione hydrolase